jgi:hypothetical protein
MGPALDGTKMWNYANEWQALNNVLRLSLGMTYKSAITGLNLAAMQIAQFTITQRKKENANK